MATTLLTNLIDPEVIAAKVEAKLTDNMVFSPIVTVDRTLEGNPGSTLKFPKYAYIGDAADVDENGQIVPVALSATSVSATVKKVAKAVQITDEAVLSGHGSPVDEAADQIVVAIDNKTDNDILEALEGVSPTRQLGTQESNISVDIVADALTLFGEDEGGAKALYISPGDTASFRKDDDFIKASDLGQQIVLKGTIGELWGCNVIPSNKIKVDTTDGEIRRYIVKPGAVKLVLKRGTAVESDREPEYMRTTIYASKHYVPYLYDESKVVMIRQFTDLKTLPEGSAVSTAATGANKTKIDIKVQAPEGFKWVYKLGEADVSNAAFGTALSGYTDWVSATTAINASTNTKAHIALVDSSNKPVKQINIDLVKGE